VIPFTSLGVDTGNNNETDLLHLEAEAAKAGIRFVKINQSHIGSDYLPKVIETMKKLLEEEGVQFKLDVKASSLEVNGSIVKAIKTKNETYYADGFLLAPGRIGSNWLIKSMTNLGVSMTFNPIDVGVRVEIPNEVMEEIINRRGCWDPKFHIYTPSYDDFARTFCVCPRGFIIKETYEDDLFGVNGYSMRKTASANTNFALIVRVKLTASPRKHY